MSAIVSPDCRDSNHQKCPGDAWDEAHDHITECECECHGGPVGAEHFAGCPCGACQAIRAARPDPPVPLAYMGCCSSIVRLTRTSPGHYAGTETHLSHCPDTGATFLPETKET